MFSKVSLIISAWWASAFSALWGRTSLSECFVAAGVLETENEPDRDAIRKAKVLYSSCMNESKAHDIF